MNTLDVSIIFVNYKTNTLLQDALKSVVEESSGFSYEVIIVDNSQDEEEFNKLKALQNENVHLIDAKANLGFGKANNLGSKIAKGRYLYFLNTDTLLINNAIFFLKEYLDKHNNVGVVGSNLYTKELKPNHSFFPIEKNLRGEKKMSSLFLATKKKLGGNRPDFNYSNEPVEIKGYACGASLMIRKDVFDQLGGFDKDIFMYAEESLLCYRVIHECNLKIVNVPSSKIIHFEGASFKGVTEWRAKTIADGNYIYYLKAFGKQEALKAMKYMKRQYFWKAQASCFVNKSKHQSYVYMYQAFKKKAESVETF